MIAPARLSSSERGEIQLGRRGKGNRIPNVVAAGTGATPAAFYLGLCRLHGILSPPASAAVILQAGRSSAQLRWCCRRAVLSCSSDDAASIPKSGLEIKNRCTLEGINRQNLASIRKSEPEIKNQCSRGVVAVCRRNHSPLPLRKLESDAENRCRKQHPPKSRHARRSAATKTNTKNSIFVNPGLTLGRVPKMRSRKGI